MIRRRSIFQTSGPQVEALPCPDFRMPRPTGPEEPTFLEMGANLLKAFARAAAAGFPTVSAEEYERRRAICNACKFWKPRARLGLGKCTAPGCGCTKLKPLLATEKCPLKKWDN